MVSQGRPLPGAVPQFGNRPYSKDIRVGGGGSFPNDPYGMVARRRNEEPGADNHGGLSLRRGQIAVIRIVAGPRTGQRIRGPYGRGF